MQKLELSCLILSQARFVNSVLFLLSQIKILYQFLTFLEKLKNLVQCLWCFLLSIISMLNYWLNLDFFGFVLNFLLVCCNKGPSVSTVQEQDKRAEAIHLSYVLVCSLVR